MAKRSHTQPLFLDRFDQADRDLVKANAKTGRPGLLEATDASGDPVLIRFWKRQAAQDDGDLVAIWRNELRLLHRLAGSKGSEDCIAKIVDAGEDRTGFYIAVSVGQRRPLAMFLDGSLRHGGWIKQPANPANRRRLWLNLTFIAKALEILHSQGLIHGNIDELAILTSGGDDIDFQLTGFEWSMRLASSTGKTVKAGTQERRFSFLDDWSAFARLAAGLLKVKPERLGNTRIAPFEVSDILLADEAALLRELIDPPNLVQIDGDFVQRRIEHIVASLGGSVASEIGQFQLFLNLGAASNLRASIRDASDHTVEVTDIDGMISFVKSDMRDNGRIIVCGPADTPRVFLRGTRLVYKLSKVLIQNQPKSTWEFARCESAELAEDWSGFLLGSAAIADGIISFVPAAESKGKIQRLRGRVPHWDRLINEAVPLQVLKLKREDRLYRALSAIHALDLVIASTDIFPITIEKTTTADDGSGDLLLSARLTPDEARDALCKSLGIRPYVVRLKELVDLDRVSEDEGWLFTDARVMTRRSATDTEVQFEDTIETDGSTEFVFRAVKHKGITPSAGMLVPGDFRGRLTQFSRTGQALKWLREHSELLRMVADPRNGVISSHERATALELASLDKSKQIAFEEIISTLPFYLVQGPPGVGKTFLVKELVRKSFSDEPASRMLLSGQSHHTVDHLMDEILAEWPADGRDLPLAVRCKTGDISEGKSVYDVARQTALLIKSFSKSQLANDCSQNLKSKIEKLTDASHGGASPVEKRAIDGLVMRSANLVFATTNARDLERLVEERGQFDWTIVEEAGKASGVDLLMPLLLSHRRLLIGDHFQLPPFGAEQMERLLQDAQNVRGALSIGLETVQPSFKEFIEDDFFAIIQDDSTASNVELLCADARRALFFFETAISDELERQEKKQGSRDANIAHVLKVQHRMHPAIAEVISRCFYKNEIENSPQSLARFEGDSPIIVGETLGACDAPILLVDMPYQQSTAGKRHVERTPRYTNSDEVDAVSLVLKNLISRSEKKASLAVLSPYARQVALLKSQLLEDPEIAAKLTSFTAVGRSHEWFNTVDAFQGNEADAVVVSLVRNNHHAALSRALGFVSNPQRMNVLLSRAKWRLVITTSLEFLKTVTSPLGSAEPAEVEFLREFLRVIESHRSAGLAKVIGFSDLKRLAGK